MSQPADSPAPTPSRAFPPYGGQASGANLADILERVLDKGIVIVGDIKVNLLDIELLTIKLRLLVASVDKAKEIGIDWWEHDPALSSRADGRRSVEEPSERRRALEEQNERLRAEVKELRSRVADSPAELPTSDSPERKPRTEEPKRKRRKAVTSEHDEADEDRRT